MLHMHRTSTIFSCVPVAHNAQHTLTRALVSMEWLALPQVWVPRGGSRYRTIEAIFASTRALASFPKMYVYSTADDVVRCTSVESHIWVGPNLLAQLIICWSPDCHGIAMQELA